MDEQTAVINKTLEMILSKLLLWKSFPNYQFERRIDIYFSFFILEILKSKNPELEIETIIPEFPLIPIRDVKNRELKSVDISELKTTAILEFGKSFKTAQADFVCIPKSEKQKIIMIELKTDAGSVDQTQLKRYRVLNGRKWKEIVGVFLGKLIAANGVDKEKYKKYLQSIKPYLPNFQILEDKFSKARIKNQSEKLQWVNSEIKEEILSGNFYHAESLVEMVYFGPEKIKYDIHELGLINFKTINDVLVNVSENKVDPRSELAILLSKNVMIDFIQKSMNL
jgi:hypothetical protein